MHSPIICQITDTELVLRYQQGSEPALEELITRHKGKVFSYILTTSGGRNRQLAEDIFQDTFIKVINTLKREAYQEEGKFINWVMRIAHNLIIDYFRKNKRIPEVDGGDDFDVFDILPNQDPTPEDKMVNEQIQFDAAKLIDYLPKDQRDVLWMRIYGNMSFKEIAEETSVSINTALGRMRYALINLRKMIDEKELVLQA